MKKHDLSRRSFLTGAAATGALAAVAGLSGCNTPAESTGSTAASNQGATNEDLSLEQGMGKWSFEIAPDPIPESDITETVENEIIVVGAGMAGMVCACSAAEHGAKVTLFSASSKPVSRGGSNFSAYNKVIEEYGLEPFDPEPFYYNEMKAASYAIDQRKWCRGHNNSEEAMNWVIDIVRADGVQVFLERDNSFEGFGPNYAIGFSGPEGADSASLGQQYAVEAVEKKAVSYGVEIIYDTIARQLIREDNNTGRVSGIIAEKADGSYVKFVGSKAIVLATGDFSADKEMVAKYCPMVIPLVGTEQTEIDYNTGFNLTGIFGGDGQKMGLWIGAAWQRCLPNAPMMQGAWAGSSEPLGFHMGLNVNANTERYQREDISSPYSANHLLSQPNFTASGIWTANYAQALIDNGHDWYFFGNKYDVPAATAPEVIERWEASVESGTMFKADTLDDLASQMGLDATKLKKEVVRYNELVAKGIDEDFHKDPSFLVTIEDGGPYYGGTNYAMFMTVMGGLRTSYKMEVCDENDTPIPGLFNVGCMVGDMYANTYNFCVPGHSYGINCITFGYLLGKDLAAGVFA